MLQHLPKLMLLAICYFAAEVTSEALAYRVQPAPPALAAPSAPAATPLPTEDMVAVLEAGAKVAAPGQAAGEATAATPAPPFRLKLVGTLVGSGGSVATLLTSEGKMITLAVGQSVQGRTLTSVEASRVWFGDTEVTLRESAEIPAVASSAPESAPESAAEPSTPAQSEAVASEPAAQPAAPESVTQAGTAGTPTRSELRAALSDASFLTTFRTEREEEGVRMTFQGDDHMFARLGLQNQDLITSVNEQPLNSLESMAELMGTLQNEDNFKLNVMRGGQPTSLSVQLGD